MMDLSVMLTMTPDAFSLGSHRYYAQVIFELRRQDHLQINIIKSHTHTHVTTRVQEEFVTEAKLWFRNEHEFTMYTLKYGDTELGSQIVDAVVKQNNVTRTAEVSLIAQEKSPVT